MAFFVNIGYSFPIDDSITPDGSVILCSSMPRHQLERRKMKGHTHLERRLFDPQLYFAGAVAAQIPDLCAKLATYPWFGVKGLEEYESSHQSQTEWMAHARTKVKSLWPGKAPTKLKEIADGALECIEFQVRKGAWAIILPSPLTIDPTSDYSAELAWLDAGLEQAEQVEDLDKPLFATIAISDNALRFHVEPKHNPLLDIVLDQVSARDVDGVYIVIEQGSEPGDTRQCGSPRTLRSLLYLVHRFAKESELRVGVNFVGAFGLACEAAGAEWWASNWYKSLYRVRLADKIGGGAVYPTYWSFPAAVDVNLESDFDTLAAAKLSKFSDQTPACDGLLKAAKQGEKASSVPAWRYAPSNKAAAIDHFLQSAVKHEAKLSALPAGSARTDFVEQWLRRSESLATWAVSKLGPHPKTKLAHPSAWLEAFENYRNDHGV